MAPFEKDKENKKGNNDVELEPLDKDEMQSIVSYEIDAAVKFCEEELSSPRQLAESYYQGKTRLKVEEGMSSVVVTKVKDTIKSIIPSVARVFTQSDVIAEFSSEDEEDELICKESTLYCNNVFHKFGGYTALISGTTDALKARVGIVRVDFKKVKVTSHSITQSINPEQLQLISADNSVKITEQSKPDEAGNIQVTLTRDVTRDRWKLFPVPPENFIIDEEATSLEDARLFGTRINKRITDVIEMGISIDDLEGASMEDGTMLDTEKFNRLGYEFDRDTHQLDKTGKQILVTEIYMRIDADGDGIAELRRIITVGGKHKIVSDEPVNYHNLAIFRVDIYPHTFFPESVAEDIIQDQDAMTAILRSIINNAALVNTPRTEVDENIVNIEDVKQNRIGGIIRVKKVGGINELTTEFVAGQTLTVFQALNENSEARSGVTKLSQGIDPDALQSTSRIAANGIMQSVDSRIEMMARNIGETGVKDLFKVIQCIAMYEINSEKSVNTGQGYQNVDPSKWHDQMTISCQVGTGNGRIEDKQQALTQVAGIQKECIAQFGLANPIAGYVQFRNTMKSLLRLSGVKNVNDYFPAIDPQALAQMDAKKAQAAQPAQQPDPSQGLIEAEKIKGQVKMQVESAKMQSRGAIEAAKLQQQQQHDMARLVMEDDRERDKQAQDYAVAAKKADLDATTKVQVAREVNKNRSVQ